MNEPKKIPVSRFNYNLPPELISQKPIKPRDRARLLILHKKSGQIEHKKFYNIVDYFKPGDVLVLNNSKVIPARLIGKKETGGKIEIFLLKKDADFWQCLIGGKVKPGQKVIFTKGVEAVVIKKSADQTWLVKFNASNKKIFAIGQTPIPPYIKQKSNLTDYQTVYAKTAGSVAAPTAGLHFTKPLINTLKKKGVKIEYITLHVGMGTFAPVKSKYIQDHKIHSEFAILDKSTAQRLNKAKKSGHKIIAVGTTTTRTLEALSRQTGQTKSLQPKSDWVDIFIYPGYKFKFVDAIITNFHLPKSTLLMLVSAFASEKKIKTAYTTAIKNKYKFYSFGDAMLIM